MDRVAVTLQQRGALEHNLHRSVVLEPPELGCLECRLKRHLERP